MIYISLLVQGYQSQKLFSKTKKTNGKSHKSKKICCYCLTFGIYPMDVNTVF